MCFLVIPLAAPPPARFSGTGLLFANGNCYDTGICWSQACVQRISCIQPFMRTNCDALDYRETALRLQKEWNMENPQQLPFAPHVTDHALVAVLNRGLLYNAVEREFAQVRNRTEMAKLTSCRPRT